MGEATLPNPHHSPNLQSLGTRLMRQAVRPGHMQQPARKGSLCSALHCPQVTVPLAPEPVKLRLQFAQGPRVQGRKQHGSCPPEADRHTDNCGAEIPRWGEVGARAGWKEGT